MNFFACVTIFAKCISFGTGVVLFLLAYRAFKSSKYQALLRDVEITKNLNFTWPKVTLIIPVCNEADTVERAARSLFAMHYSNIEFIFVNDRSTDGTDVILTYLAAEEPRMKIITVTELPANWLGKVHAFKQGVEQATGEWILFSDADVHYHQFSLKKALTYSYDHQLDFLAVLPSIVGGTTFVRILSAQMLHYMTFLVDFSKIKNLSYKNAIAHGAFMLVQKKAYLNSRGFDALKMEVLDDVGFALEMKSSGAKMAILSGLDEIDFEWYTNLKAFIHGFEKNGFASMQYSRFFLLLAFVGVVLFFCGYTILPIFTHDVFYMGFVWCALVLYLLTAQKTLKNIIYMPSWCIAIFPFSILFVMYIITRSGIKCLKQKGLYWRGTFYPLSELKRSQRFKILRDSPE